MDMQQTIVLLIGIALGGVILFRIIRAFRRKDATLCSGCAEKDCPHRNKAENDKGCCHK